MIGSANVEAVVYETVEPNAAALIESLRDIGYSLSTAIADIIDNSLAARAGKVSIRVHADPDDAAIGIIDDGAGMSSDELMEAMRPGSRNPTEARLKEDLGRFGLGLKTASFSQCRRLTVVTRKESVTSVAIWDLDVVVKRNQWVVERRSSSQGIRFADLLVADGTLVLWEKLDRVGLELGNETLLRQLDETAKDLELIFHRFMKAEPGYAGVSFDINKQVLSPCDPFAEWHDATIRQPVDRRHISGNTVTIQAFILPHRNKVSSDAEWKRMGLVEGHMRSQGFYLYRNRRLIRHATWFRMAPQHLLTQLARVRIDIGNDSDTAWKIDVLKSSASPPPALRNHLRQLIDNLGGKSKRVYRKRGAKLTEENPLPLWQRTKIDSKISYSLNPVHPSFARFEAGLSDQQICDFHELLRLASAGLPLEALHHDMVDNYEAIQPEKLDEVDIRSSAVDLIAQLREMGHADSEILRLLKSIPPYSAAPAVVAKLMSESGHHD